MIMIFFRLNCIKIRGLNMKRIMTLLIVLVVVASGCGKGKVADADKKVVTNAVATPVVSTNATK